MANATVRRAPCVELTVLLFLCASTVARAQDEGRIFAGVVFGVATLSADARSETTSSEAQVSLYKPENGLAVNAFAGVHLANYFSVQANYMWNANDLMLLSSTLGPRTGALYEEQRDSAQHAIVVDGLIYFRGRDSAVRPYVGTGVSVFRFTSDTIRRTVAGHSAALPAERIASSRVGLRSAVGIDVAVSRRMAFRYSFSETISRNPIGPHLTPQGERGLANFQNLFGLVARF